MAAEKKAVVIYTNWITTFEKLSDEEAGRLVKHMFRYINDLDPEPPDRLTEIMFTFLEDKLDESIRNTRTGKYHWNWKGGITSENKNVRNSIEMKEWRNNVLKRNEWTCRSCYKKGGDLHAHHIKPFALFPELRFEINNGLTLCKKCHIKAHKIKWRDG